VSAQAGGESQGFTVMEMLVVLALLGVMVGISAIALRPVEQSPEASLRVEGLRARGEAVRTGRPVWSPIPRAETADSTLPRERTLFLPDGSARGRTVDLLTGAPHEEE